MNYTEYSNSDLPPPTKDKHAFKKYHIALNGDKLECSEVEAWDFAYDFGDEEVKRRIFYNCRKGRIWYVSDLEHGTMPFTIDLYNKLIPYYRSIAGILDTICNGNYDHRNDTEEMIEIEHARFKSWSKEIENFDDLLSNIRIGIY